MSTHTTAVAGRSPRNDAAQTEPSHPPAQRRFADLMLGRDRRTRIRVQQWLTAAMTYAGSSIVVVIDLGFDWVGIVQLTSWLVSITVCQAIFYVMLRSGLSAQWRDPALTVAQILTGIVFANWAFLILGHGRAVALMPMLLVLVFGAFLLHWRKIAVLTAVAIAGFAVVVAASKWLLIIGHRPAAPETFDQDLLYCASLLTLLPAAGVLAARLSRMRAALSERSNALSQALAEVERLAEFDELTGLANRRRARTYLATQFAKPQGHDLNCAVALIDLDHFKRINDTLGHDGGDRVLQAFAAAARPVIRATDLLSRWGGEEFLLVMPHTSIDEASALLRRLLDRVRKLSLENGGAITFSAGIVPYDADVAIDVAIAHADRRMYLAKNAGRNRICATG